MTRWGEISGRSHPGHACQDAKRSRLSDCCLWRPYGGKVRIGKKADEDDLRVIKTGKENLETNSTRKHFEVELPLEDAKKTTIGALGVVFKYKPADDKSAYQKKAEQLRDELREQIPSADKLTEAR